MPDDDTLTDIKAVQRAVAEVLAQDAFNDDQRYNRDDRRYDHPPHTSWGGATEETRNAYIAVALGTAAKLTLSGLTVHRLPAAATPGPDLDRWWHPPMRTAAGRWLKQLFAHPCDGLPYSEDGYDERGPIITVRQLMLNMRAWEQRAADE